MAPTPSRTARHSDDGSVVGGQSFDKGMRKGQQGDLVRCSGEDTFTLSQFGEVRAVLQFDGFFTPRGKS